MAKHQKVLSKLCSIPPSANIKWDELKAVLEHLGYVMMKITAHEESFITKKRMPLSFATNLTHNRLLIKAA
jgi:hypothetical protein